MLDGTAPSNPHPPAGWLHGTAELNGVDHGRRGVSHAHLVLELMGANEISSGYHGTHSPKTHTHIYIYIYIHVYVCMYIYIYIMKYCNPHSWCSIPVSDCCAVESCTLRKMTAKSSCARPTGWWLSHHSKKYAGHWGSSSDFYALNVCIRTTNTHTHIYIYKYKHNRYIYIHIYISYLTYICVYIYINKWIDMHRCMCHHGFTAFHPSDPCALGTG